MNTYKRHRFPPDIVSYAIWLYYRFNLSHRDIEDLLGEHGITVSRESIRLWCIKLGAKYAGRLKRRYQGYGDTFYIECRQCLRPGAYRRRSTHQNPTRPSRFRQASDSSGDDGDSWKMWLSKRESVNANLRWRW